MFIPVVLILIQLNFWFAYDSLQTGQQTILKVKLGDDRRLMDTSIEIKSDPGIKIETQALRIIEDNEIDWRIRALEKGVHHIYLSLDNAEYTKSLSVGQKRLSKISPLKIQKKFFRELGYPVERPLPKNSGIESIEIVYPKRNLNLFGLRLHWLIAFFVLSIIFGFSLKGFFGIEI
jgi:hypothetical protein